MRMFKISHDLKIIFKKMAISRDRISLFPGSGRLQGTRIRPILSLNRYCYCQAPTVCQKCPNLPGAGNERFWPSTGTITKRWSDLTT